YTSAMIKSRRTFRSGRFEARMKLPTGAGTWPAFWLVGPGPWPDTGEIDVVEHYARFGSGDNMFGFAESNLHSTPPLDQPRNTSRGRLARTPIAPAEWHVYGVEWRPDEIRFSIDGELTEAHARPASDPDGSWPFDDYPESIVFDLFLGGTAGPVDAAALPQQLLVDWVRVWPIASR
ncbi:MAG: glycoside hydrolase family 16 protein, partial [Aquihabitans sp.]